ncbi:MAG: hypothetical protein U5K00_15645 [Melioribacteraceae bacterium]|nr:hypothetical protein [Melioribacteraceae bacterium]
MIISSVLSTTLSLPAGKVFDSHLTLVKRAVSRVVESCEQTAKPVYCLANFTEIVPPG